MSDRLNRVIGNYEVKLRLGANGRLSEREIRTRVARYTVAALDEERVLQAVRQVLCSNGVVTWSFPFYHAFSRELGKLKRAEMSPERLQEEFIVKVAKWVSRGLHQPVLLEIGLSVFDLMPPSAPQPEEGLTKST